MKILLLSYFYPPFQAAGASRAGQMVKGWRTAGADVIVLAATPTDIPRFGDLGPDVEWTHPFEVNTIPRLIAGRSVVESGFERPRPALVRGLGRAYRQVINFPDGQIGWLPTALSAARRLIERHRPDVIVTSSPPATAHLVALRLRRTGTRIPWIAELRDPWTGNPNMRRWAPLRSLEWRLEGAVLRAADALVTVSPGLARRYSTTAREVHLMTNGFTPEEYPRGGHAGDDLVHVGTVYPTYDLATLLAALRAAAHPPPVRFVGRNLGPLREALARAGGASIELAPPVPRAEALRVMSRAWANLAFIYRSPSGRGVESEYAQQKFYEYVGARRPIIAIGPEEGDGAAVLRSSGLVRFAGNADELRALLDDRAWTDDVRVDLERTSQYSYETIARRYLELIERVIARAAPAR